jgi:AmmeMemoRadiSam system protein B
MADPLLRARFHPDCYPSSPGKALKFFRDAAALVSESDLPAPPRRHDLLGIITPHIDFRVSLRAYAAAFRPLWDAPLADTYIILGVGHRSRLEWNLDRRDYETPLGLVECARDAVEELAGEKDDARFFSPEAHAGEHSIEFPLLWLQALHRLHPGAEKSRGFRFVPLLCGNLAAYVDGGAAWDDLDDFHRLSRALAKLLAREPNARVIVSIDGCHLGPRFRHPFPVTPALLQATAGWENLLWACAAKGDARTFLDWFRDEGNDRYFDGVGAIALLLAAGAGKFLPERTYYEPWFTEADASAVTFSSGRVWRQSVQPSVPRGVRSR